MTFKVGDRVKSTHNSNDGMLGIIEYHRDRDVWHIRWDDGKVYGGTDNNYCEDFLELVSEIEGVKNHMTFSRVTLTESQKANLSEDAQALVEAGYYTSDLYLASQTHFVGFLANKFQAEYAAKAKAELAEADKKEKAKR